MQPLSCLRLSEEDKADELRQPHLNDEWQNAKQHKHINFKSVYVQHFIFPRHNSFYQNKTFHPDIFIVPIIPFIKYLSTYNVCPYIEGALETYIISAFQGLQKKYVFFL